MQAREIRKALTRGKPIMLYAPQFEKYCRVAASEIRAMMEGMKPTDPVNAEAVEEPDAIYIDFQI